MNNDKPRPAAPEPDADGTTTATGVIELSARDLQHLLAQVFRVCDEDETQDLEETAGGRGNLVACLDFFVKQGQSFEADDYSLFRSAVVHRRQNLQAAHRLTPEELNRCAERWKNVAPAPSPKKKKKSTRRNRHSHSFRDQIIRYLHDEKGFSWPKAERGFRAVFDVIARCVRRGEVVTLPGLGVLKAENWEGKHQEIYFRRLHNIHTHKSRYRVVPLQKDQRRIRFIPNKKLDLTPPPAPPTPEQVEARNLVAALLGHPVDDSIMTYLEAAIDAHSHQPGALLRRLHEARKRDWRYPGPGAVDQLAADLAFLYWI